MKLVQVDQWKIKDIPCERIEEPDRFFFYFKDSDNDYGPGHITLGPDTNPLTKKCTQIISD